MHSYQLCSTALVQHFLILRRFAMASNLGTTCDMYHTKLAGTTTIVKTSFAIYIPMQLELLLILQHLTRCPGRAWERV